MDGIYRATEDDVLKIAPLFDAYRQFYGQTGDIHAAGNFLYERLANMESVVFYCIAGGRMAGFTQLYPIFSSVSLSPAWLLNDLFVDPSFRGAGVASLLLDAAAEHGRQTESKWLLLSTADENHPAQSLYEKKGWKKSSDFYYQYNL